MLTVTIVDNLCKRSQQEQARWVALQAAICEVAYLEGPVGRALVQVEGEPDWNEVDIIDWNYGQDAKVSARR